MTALVIRPKRDCRWDLVALGEVMIRFDPGDRRVATARRFDVWEGGGEYNVARGLRRCFQLDTAIVTALADNPVGRLIEDLINQGGVDQSHVLWRAFDGVGRAVRNGLYFAERGSGLRGASACSDRGHSAASQLAPGEIDWEHIFGTEGVRWFHCGGIFCALSEGTAAVAKEACEAARRHGTIISFDLNYRESLWQACGGPARAAEVYREFASMVDVLIGNDGHFRLVLGIEGEAPTEPDSRTYDALFREVERAYPNLKLIAATLRSARSATQNGWGAACRYEDRLYQATYRDELEIFDRIGGGDAFAAGLFYGFLAGRGPQHALELGAAHGALAMTTPGDSSMATLDDVESLAAGGGPNARR